MRFTRAKTRQAVELRAAILVALLLALYTVALYLVDIVRDYFHPTSRLSLLYALSYCLAIWLLGLLWLTYRRWYRTTITDRDLERILTQLDPDVYLVVSPERRILLCNQAVHSMFGYAPEELVNQTTDLLYEDRRSPGVTGKEIHDHLLRVGFHVGRATGKRRDGTTFPLEITTGTVKGRTGAVLLLRDIERQVKAEEAYRERAALLAELEANHEKQKEMERHRDSLIHMIVHDMKTPLQVIVGNIELLHQELEKQGAASQMARTYAGESLEQTQRLIEMVNSLLEVRRLESGNMPLHRNSYDLRLATNRAVAALQPLTNGRKVTLNEPPHPVTAHCDPQVIHRVLVNLIGNALHHTPEDAHITVRVSTANGVARVEVADTGPGIPPEDQSRVFDKFIQLKDRQGPRLTTSTGLGLNFCKLAVEQHGGKIGVVSTNGGGATFWFTLPRHAPNARVPDYHEAA